VPWRWPAGLGFGFWVTLANYPSSFRFLAPRGVIHFLDARAGSPRVRTTLLRWPIGEHCHDRSLSGGMQAGRPSCFFWKATLLQVLAYYQLTDDNQSWLAAITAVLETVRCHCRGKRTTIPIRPSYVAMARHAAWDLPGVQGHPPRLPSQDA